MTYIPEKKELFFLVSLNAGRDTTRKICKFNDVSDSHIYKLSLDLEKKGIIKKEKKGRTKTLKLTTKGKQLLLGLSEALNPKN